MLTAWLMNQDNINPKRFIYEQLQNMLTYCLKYKKKTENVNSKVLKTEIGERTLSSRFLKEKVV